MYPIARLLILIAALLGAGQPVLAAHYCAHPHSDSGQWNDAMANADSGCGSSVMVERPTSGDHGSCSQQACGNCTTTLNTLAPFLVGLPPTVILRHKSSSDEFPVSPFPSGPYKPPRQHA